MIAATCALACSVDSGDERGSNVGEGGNGGSANGTGIGNGTGTGNTGNGSGTGNTGSGGIINTGATGGEGGNQECESVSEQAESKLLPVDIIWAIDSSGSMDGEIQQVQNNMNGFSNAVFGTGVDIHVVLIARETCIPPPLGGVPCGQPNTNGNGDIIFQHVQVGIGSTNALSQYINTYPQYKSTLRKEALKYFAVVTDDNSNMSAAAFTQALADINAMDGYFNNWKFMGIYCTGGCPDFFACADTGTVYQQLVQQTGGVTGDLCGNNQNFAPVFQQMAQTISSSTQLSCNLDIPPPPMGQVFDKNKVNVTFTPSGGAPTPIYNVPDEAGCAAAGGGWYYDDPANPSQIIMCPGNCGTLQADKGGKTDVQFGCQTEIGPPK